MAEKITVYTTGPSCARCTLTKNVMTSKGIAFVEVNIRDNEAARAYVVEDLGYTEAPVVVVNDEDHWSGFRPDHIDRIVKRAISPSDATGDPRSHSLMEVEIAGF